MHVHQKRITFQLDPKTYVNIWNAISVQNNNNIHFYIRHLLFALAIRQIPWGQRGVQEEMQKYRE